MIRSVVRLYVVVTDTKSTSTLIPTVMGKLNIAHHKSYHPYRRDNIERVRRDEEEAKAKEQMEDGRMMLAVRLNLAFGSMILINTIRMQRLVWVSSDSELAFPNPLRRRERKERTTTT